MVAQFILDLFEHLLSEILAAQARAATQGGLAYAHHRSQAAELPSHLQQIPFCLSNEATAAIRLCSTISVAPSAPLMNRGANPARTSH
jgi:hypothetical protein